ncbi:MAG: hypothetical protein ABSH48_14660 [Verrucomicrobiota bacterium]|jgi:hypothetical protein
MFAFAVKLTVQRFGWAVVVTLGLPALAQQTIQFSPPVNPDPVSDAKDLEATRPLPGALSAPSSLFGDQGSSFDDLPGSPQPILFNGNPVQLQRFLNNRKNWALLTPKEILNIPTAESILGISDSPDEFKLSPAEQFIRRQDRESQVTATNGMRRAGATLDRDNALKAGPLSDLDDERRSNPSGATVSAALKDLKPFDNRDLRLAAGTDRSDPVWTSPFGVPVMDTKPTLEQLADRERFSAFLDGPTPAVKPINSALATPSGFAQDINGQSPAASKSVGRAYTSIAETIGKPTGLLPFPGLGAQPPPPKKLSLVQPPPWLPDSSQSSTFPQRQF